MLKLLCKEFQAVGSTFRIMMMPLTAVSGQSMAYNMVARDFTGTERTLELLSVLLKAVELC